MPHYSSFSNLHRLTDPPSNAPPRMCVVFILQLVRRRRRRKASQSSPISMYHTITSALAVQPTRTRAYRLKQRRGRTAARVRRASDSLSVSSKDFPVPLLVLSCYGHSIGTAGRAISPAVSSSSWPVPNSCSSLQIIAESVPNISNHVKFPRPLFLPPRTYQSRKQSSNTVLGRTESQVT